MPADWKIGVIIPMFKGKRKSVVTIVTMLQASLYSSVD